MSDAEINMEVQRRGLRVALERGDYKLVDRTARTLIERFPEEGWLYATLAELANALRRYHWEEHFAEKAQSLGAAVRSSGERIGAPVGERYLLATEWGFGFWADVNHVIGSLLIAEMARRLPVVVWSENSLFSGGPGNAWETYFEPVSAASVDDVAAGASVFPPPWSLSDFRKPDFADIRSTRPQSTYGLALLPREERTVVSDTFVHVGDLAHWLEPGEPYFGASVLEVERALARKYLRLNARVSRKIDGFWREKMDGRRWLAVHFRGADKGSEVRTLNEINAQYFPRMDTILREDPGLSLFLMTDSAPFLRVAQHRFGERLLVTPSLRSESATGVHHAGHDPVTVADDVIMDTYLAARCERFLGNGTSNVSLAVGMLTDWTSDHYELLGPNWRASAFNLKAGVRAL